MSPLERAYRRLMWAYPRWYRQERGTEMVTALLDDAAPGQRRPPRTDVVDLLTGGVRARLRPPRDLGVRLVCVLVALYLALVGAAAAVLLSGYTGPPTEAQAIAAATTAVPVQPHNVPGPPVRCDTVCPPFDGADAVVAYQTPPDSTDTTVVRFTNPGIEAAQARDRLIAAGWTVGPLRSQPDGFRWFDAAEGDLEMHVTFFLPDDSLTVNVSKSFQVAALARLLIGLAVGFIAGWLAIVWVMQRYRRQPLLRRLFTGLAATPMLLIALVTIYAVAMSAIFEGATGRHAKMIKLPLFAFPGFWWPIVVVAAGSAVAALTLAVTRSEAPPGVPEPIPL
jgi:hypothetical protein